MPGLLLSLARWLFGKALGIAFAVALAVAIFAFWLFANDRYESESARVAQLSALEEQAGETYSKLQDIHSRLVTLGGEIDDTRRRIQSAERAIARLGGIMERIERWLTLSAAERAEMERELAEAQRERETSERQLGDLIGEQSTLRIDRAVSVEKARALETSIGSLEQASSGFVEYVDRSWARLKPWIIGAVLVIVFLPVALKIVAYYIFAPLVARVRPMRFEKSPLALPLQIDSGVSVQIQVEKGQRLWVKESYLQASDESLRRRTRFVLNWSIPFTCVAAGLIELIELRGEDARGKVTVSPQKRAEIEVALIGVPAESKLIVRPSCIAAVASPEGHSIAIKRRWRLLHPQAWLTLQFRYFEFQGPCSIVVTGIRGVRVEILDTSSESGRRSNQIATIGFTPDLGYGAARAETFWSYFRGFNPLFDDVFRGRGLFLCQEITEKDASAVSRFWLGIWNGALKILGI